jgi:hypothetical protein
MSKPASVVMTLTLLTASLACCSCSGSKEEDPVFPVQGKVRFQGKPASGAVVVLHPLNRSKPAQGFPRAVVEEDGSFAVTTFTAKDGAPAGDYAVSITWDRTSVKVQGQKGHARKIPTNFPLKYADPKTSGFVVHIQEGSNELRPFDIED